MRSRQRVFKLECKGGGGVLKPRSVVPRTSEVKLRGKESEYTVL